MIIDKLTAPRHTHTMAKKRAKKLANHRLLPIITLSLVVAIGIIFLKNFLKPTPISINELSSDTTITCVYGFDDKFENNTLDPLKWNPEINLDGELVGVNGGKLGLTSPVNNSVLRVFGNKPILGDFVAEVDIYTPIAKPITEKSQYAQFIFREPTSQGNYAGIARNSDGQIMSFAVGGYYGPLGISATTKYADIPKDTVVRAKIVRIGTGLKIYYKTNGGYTLLGDYPDIQGSDVAMTARLNLGPIDGGPLTASTTTFDNYSLSCTTPTPTNLDSTCAPDGKKVTLRWDDVSPGKYHFGLNDPTENDSDWYKPGTTDVWRGGDLDQTTYELPIVPGRTYEWWVQSNEGGPSTPTSRTASAQFKCEPKPAAVTNLRHTCATDGKSVRLMWDGVANVDFYKLRLDDKKGNIRSIDNLTGNTEHVAAITPGQTYTWWAHSSKAGYDSLESEHKEFKCNFYASPTPTALPAQAGKPTVKPSVKASSTPTPSPVATPKTSPKVLFDNTPSSIPTGFDVAPSPTPSTPPQSSNFVSRFFRWLASVFE